MVLRCMCLRVRNSIPIQIHEIKNTAKKKASLSNDRERALERAHEYTSFRLVSEFWIELRRDKIVNELKRKRESEQRKEIEREQREGKGDRIDLSRKVHRSQSRIINQWPVKWNILLGYHHLYIGLNFLLSDEKEIHTRCSDNEVSVLKPEYYKWSSIWYKTIF